MGYPGGVQVDPGRLRQVAAEVDRASTAVAKAYTARKADLPVPASAADGWASVPAVQAAAQAWESFVDRLAGSVRGLGGDLRAAADGYQTSDAAAANRMPRGGRQPV